MDSVLDEYITSGEPALLSQISQGLHIIGPQNFTRYALAIAPSVQELRTKSNVHGVFVHRLVFTVRYARFHELMEKREYQDAASDLIAIFSENVAPTSWWAVVLYDSAPLLRYGKLPISSPSVPPLKSLEQVLNFCFLQRGQCYSFKSWRKFSSKRHKELAMITS